MTHRLRPQIFKNFGWFAVVSMLAAAIAGAPALAQIDLLGAEFPLQGPSNADVNVAPAVASDPAGNFVAVWQRQASGSYQIFARLFDRSGAALGSEFQVNQSSAGCHRFPAVARDGAGNFVVVWQSEPGTGGSDIVARKFSASGTPTSGELTVNSTSGTRTHPAVAAAPTGELLVVWQSDGADGSSWGVYGQNYTRDAVPVRTGTSEFLVNQTTAGAQDLPGVAFLPSNGGTPRYAVVWESSGGSPSGILLRTFSAAGAALQNELQVNAVPFTGQGAPRLAVDASGNIVVVWQSQNEEMPGTGYGVLLRRFTAGGTPLSGELLINATTAGDQFEPAVASDASGNFLVAWTSALQDGSGLGVFAVGVDRRLVASTAELQLYGPASASGDQHLPAVAASAGGRIFAVWQSDGSPALVQGRTLQVRGLNFFALPPLRIYDSRTSPNTILAAGESRPLDFTGLGGIPPTAKALSLNVTVAGPAAAGSLTVLPNDAPLATTTTVWYDAGGNRADNAVVPLARDGTVRVRAVTTQRTHLVIDINGYFQ